MMVTLLNPTRNPGRAETWREDENSVTGNETGLQHQKPSNQMNQVITLRKRSYNY